VFKIPLSFHLINPGWLRTGFPVLGEIPFLDNYNPRYIKGSIIPHNHQPTGVVNTAHLDNPRVDAADKRNGRPANSDKRHRQVEVLEPKQDPVATAKTSPFHCACFCCVELWYLGQHQKTLKDCDRTPP